MSSSGINGSKFWNLAYKYTTAIERKLTIYALQQQGYPILDIISTSIGPNSFKLETEEGVLKEKNYQQLWKKWEGDEIAFYKACYRHIQQLDAEKMSNLLGIEENVIAQKLQTLAQKMAAINIPDFLQLDTAHTLYQEIQSKPFIQLTDGKTLQFSPIQKVLLKMFQGTTPTLQIVQKGNVMKQNMVHLIESLLAEGVLKRV